ncbi:MAG: hypothetical protein B6I20_13960 [Bacteroidetes bacterium 4572_117]|nr:MAG: hypothetical protein B6I20_13960 [Bacteroidetes bacterium 4572_117]
MEFLQINKIKGIRFPMKSYLSKLSFEFGRNPTAHPELKKLEYFESPYWKFDHGDWFEADPCTNVDKDPEWYAPDLVKNIKNSTTKHEFGCHTFSHIDCRESVCTPEVFKSELNECRKHAKLNNLDLKSFVYPGHTIGNIDYLKDLGFSSYRSNFINTLGLPVKRKDGLWEHKSTVEFDIRPNWSMEYHIYRYKKLIDRAIKSNTTCHFWFHPSFSNQFLTEIMPEVLKYIDSKRSDIWVTTMKEYTEWLNENC